MLEVKHVTKKYQDTLANQDVNFALSNGEIGLLLGPNGAGKSTLIKCIMGLLRFQGEIEIDGLGNKTTEAKSIMGYVPEMPSLYDLLTVEEHVEFIIRAYRLDDSAKAYGEELLTRFDLADKRKKLGRELSKGMQQKVSIICAVLPRPKMILLDEPLVGLDPHGIKELRELLHEMKRAGTTIILSTHMLDSVEGFWDQAFIMVKGKILATCSKSQEQESGQSLEELFFAITEGKE